MFVHRSFMYHIISSPQITSCTTQKCISFITNPQYLLWSRGHIIHHNCIERLFEYSCQYSDTNRQKEVILSRLLLGRCGLNHYLHQMKRHPATELYDTCHTKKININICSIELKWDGKITKIWYDNEIEMNTNNGVTWRWFIVPKEVKQINGRFAPNKSGSFWNFGDFQKTFSPWTYDVLRIP